MNKNVGTFHGTSLQWFMEKAHLISKDFYLRFNIELAPTAPNANKPKTDF